MTENKVTTVFPAPGSPISDELLQAHFDEMNADGYRLVAVDNLVGWYRFFWEKEVQS